MSGRTQEYAPGYRTQHLIGLSHKATLHELGYHQTLSSRTDIRCLGGCLDQRHWLRKRQSDFVLPGFDMTSCEHAGDAECVGVHDIHSSHCHVHEDSNRTSITMPYSPQLEYQSAKE